MKAIHYQPRSIFPKDCSTVKEWLISLPMLIIESDIKLIPQASQCSGKG